MKVFVWYAKQDPQLYGQGRRFIKIYAVAEDEASARRQVDLLIPKKGLDAGLLRIALAESHPQVFSVPFAEINISDGRQALALVAAQNLV